MTTRPEASAMPTDVGQTESTRPVADPLAPWPAGNGRFAGRTALVTGGSRGVGRAVCLELARGGADVAFTYRRDHESADETLALLNGAGARGLALLGSVDAPADNEAVLRSMTEKLAAPDILVNNAGIVSSGRDVVSTPLDEVERLMQVHAFGPLQLCRLVVPSMRERGAGDIVMISSVATRNFLPCAAPYAMAKAAGEALAYTLAAEEERRGIRVNVVAPGLIDTDMGRRLVAARPRGELGALSTPEEVASLVGFVISPANGDTGRRFGIEVGALTSPT